MEFIAEVTDLGAPEIAVTGIASIERISVGQVRVSYYSMRKDGAVSVVHIVWDMQAYLDTFAVHKQAMDVIARLPADGGRRDGGRRAAH